MTTQPAQSIEPFLRALVDSGGSDLHCKTGSPPRVRIDGRLRKLQVPDLTAADTEHMVNQVMRADLREEFARTNEADFAYTMPGLGRFRVNAFRGRGEAGLVFRRVTDGAIPLTSLGVPDAVSALALEPRGLVLVTGPTGSGKTTTMAGMIDHINDNREVHVMTIEDPIEVIHHDKKAMINQREVRVDTDDFSTAMRAAMRQDPDVIFVGEMPDIETVVARRVRYNEQSIPWGGPGRPSAVDIANKSGVAQGCAQLGNQSDHPLSALGHIGRTKDLRQSSHSVGNSFNGHLQFSK